MPIDDSKLFKLIKSGNGNLQGWLRLIVSLAVLAVAFYTMIEGRFSKIDDKLEKIQESILVVDHNNAEQNIEIASNRLRIESLMRRVTCLED